MHRLKPVFLAAILSLMVSSGIGILAVSMRAIAADDCFEAAKLYGFMMRGSLICNFSEGPALWKAIALVRKVCPASDDAIRPGLEEGYRTFDRERQRDGEKKACADTGKFMSAIGEGTP